MMTLVTTLLIFAFLALCGRGWLAAFNVRIGHARTWLIAPVLGFCLNVVLFLITNQAGIPLEKVARLICAGLFVLSVGAITWRRSWHARGLGLFVLIGLGLLAISAWPMLHYGFNWTSYGNDDMTNYCLGAERMLRHGFYDVPTVAELAGTDYSQYYWFMHVAALVRVGSEVLLSGVAGTIGRPPVEVFMPVMFSLAVAQLWALGALLYTCPRRRRHALLACALLIFCPLWNYGTLVQLIAQVGGIGLLLAMITMTVRRRFARSWPARVRQAAVIGLLAAGMAVIYPEVIGFLVLTIGVTTAGYRLRTRQMIRGQVPVALLSAAVMVLLIRHNAFSTYIMSVSQAGGATTLEEIGKTIFPYMLVPKGASYLMGFETIMRRWSEPWGSVGIGLGFAGLLVCAFRALRGLRWVAPASSLLVIMLLVGTRLFLGNNGFGLFKLAMFSLPVVVAELAGFLTRPGFRGLKLAFAAGLCLAWLPICELYVHYSQPGRGNVFLEIEEASRSRGQQPDGHTPLLADIMSMSLAKLAAMAPGGSSVSFRSQPFFKPIMELRLISPPDWSWKLNPLPETPAIRRSLEQQMNRQVFLEKNAFGTTFLTTPPDPGPARTRLLTSVQELSSFNALSHLGRADGLYTQIPLSELKNHLVFIHSDTGQHYYLGRTGSIAVYKAQADPYSLTGSFFAIGQSLVFEVLNPSPRVRVRFSLTDSILGFGRTRLPGKTAAFGQEAAPASFGIIGSGSANVYSQPIEPLVLAGRHYIAINLFRPPDHFPPDVLQGLNLLYNRSVQLDPRLMNGYCRDISLVSEEEYQAMERPHEIHRFPEDLIGRPNFEYSGIYEDGWVSRDCFLVLGAVKAGDRLEIGGMLPELPGNTRALADNTLELWLNGELASRTPIEPGKLEISHTLTADAPLLRVELRFSREVPLPGNDRRPIAALLTSVAVQSEN